MPKGTVTTVFMATGARYADRGELILKDCSEARPMHLLAKDDTVAGDLWSFSRRMAHLQWRASHVGAAMLVLVRA
jgi:hypothetical protein